MFCASCRATVPAGAQFCASCGASTATAAPPVRSRTAGAGIADYAVIAATVALSPVFSRVFNFVRFVIALIGIAFIVRAISSYRHGHGEPATGFAALGIFASFVAAFVLISIAAWLGVVPRMARRLYSLR